MKHLQLAKKNKEVSPESWDNLYGHLVSKKFRKKYSPDQTEAIVNNYLDDPTNEKYIAEMRAMQDYRKQCKEEVKRDLGITN